MIQARVLGDKGSTCCAHSTNNAERRAGNRLLSCSLSQHRAVVSWPAAMWDSGASDTLTSPRAYETLKNRVHELKRQQHKVARSQDTAREVGAGSKNP